MTVSGEGLPDLARESVMAINRNRVARFGKAAFKKCPCCGGDLEVSARSCCTGVIAERQATKEQAKAERQAIRLPAWSRSEVYPVMDTDEIPEVFPVSSFPVLYPE